MYKNYCPCYLHLYLPCFLTNCLQNARNAVSDSPFFQNFLGGGYPQTPLRARPSALEISRQRRSNAPPPPSKNPGYGPAMYFMDLPYEMAIHSSTAGDGAFENKDKIY